MSENDIVDTGIPLPRIADVKPVPPSTLIVIWAAGRRAGLVDRVDVAPIINTYKILRPLRKNDELFNTAHLEDGGDVIAWNGTDLELSAEVIESLAEQTMTPAQFVAFMKRNNLTEEAVAAILDYSRRQIGYFKTTGPIPRVVALACVGYEKEMSVKSIKAAEANALSAIEKLIAGEITVKYEPQDQAYLPRPKIKVA